MQRNITYSSTIDDIELNCIDHSSSIVFELMKNSEGQSVQSKPSDEPHVGGSTMG